MNLITHLAPEHRYVLSVRSIWFQNKSLKNKNRELQKYLNYGHRVYSDTREKKMNY